MAKWSMISVSRPSVHHVVLCALAPWSQSHSSIGLMYWRQERKGANDVFLDTLTVTMPKDCYILLQPIFSRRQRTCAIAYSMLRLRFLLNPLVFCTVVRLQFVRLPCRLLYCWFCGSCIELSCQDIALCCGLLRLHTPVRNTQQPGLSSHLKG